MSQRGDEHHPGQEDAMNIDTAQRALDAANGRARRAKTDGEKRSTGKEVARCEAALAKANGQAARQLERQGFEVARRR
jgi:hypothetical protein